MVCKWKDLVNKWWVVKPIAYNGNDMKRTDDKLKKGMWLLSRKAIKNALANAFISRVRERNWEYGYVGAKNARRHKKNGNVQFVLWRVGDQKEVDGIGHTSEKWVNFDKSWWVQFTPNNDI